MKISDDTNEIKRLRILSNEEIETLYGRPCFTPEDRLKYFSLSLREKEAMQILHSTKSQVYFILLLGYFKAKRQFFIFEFHEVDEDFQYVWEYHFSKSEKISSNPINKSTRLKHQRLILHLVTYRSCTAKERKMIEERARKAVMVCSKPVYIFREIMNYLNDQKIIIPGYRFMRDMIGKTITNEQERLIMISQKHLKQPDIDLLKQLMEESSGQFEITKLRHEPKDFSAGEIKREIQRGKQIQSLYKLTITIIPELHISNESVKYYASLVGYYSVYKLKRLDEWLVYVYILCFVHHRYQQMLDNLIKTLIYYVRQYSEESKSTAKDLIYESYKETNQNMKKVGQLLKIFTDDNIETTTPFQSIQKTAFAILEREKLVALADQITKSSKYDENTYQWEHIDTLSRQFKRHLRPILLMVDFAASSINDPLIKVIDFLKLAFINNKPLGQYLSETLPTDFLPQSLYRYIYNEEENKTIRVDRYEFLVYRLLRNGLEAGDIFCRESIRFRSFEDDLLDQSGWLQKEKLIADVDLLILNQPIQDHLAELQQMLESRIIEINRRIASGENKQFQIKNRGSKTRWSLQYSRETEFTNHPFFDKLKQIDIGSILYFANQHCQFLESFEHVLGRYAKQDRDNQILVACLIAWGTNMGLGRMGEISDIGYSLLEGTSDNFIRLETLKEANDRVSNATFQLPIFKYFDIDAVIHSSSDGQKYETRINTINSQHSPKYFGLRKGIVSDTLVANHIPIIAKIIGSNDHESHYVFDLLYNNSTDIHPVVHSTDTHGTNEVNFAILHFFGYRFAPRYQDIFGKVSKSLCGFNAPSYYDNLVIKPVRKINVDLIKEEWENIQRIILSLALKTTTQSTIIGKLSSYARKNKTKSALWEYDNIIKSLYFLKYIDSSKLRCNVQQALNRGESFHKLKRAVSYANFGKLRLRSELEQQLWGECSRLLTNCIIYYNASILSNLLTFKEKAGQDLGILKNISPVAWQHINLYGRYEFIKRPEAINMEEIINQLAKLKLDEDILNE